MNAEEKAALLAKGEQTLKMLEGIFDRFLQEGRYDEAWDMAAQYAGAAVMLENLVLITAKDSDERSDALYKRYRDTKYPIRQKGAV